MCQHAGGSPVIRGHGKWIPECRVLIPNQGDRPDSEKRSRIAVTANWQDERNRATALAVTDTETDRNGTVADHIH